jgi:hypothetical protein
LLAHLFEHLERAAARYHEVLGDHLEPVYGRMSVENVSIVLPPQADTETKEWKIRAIHDSSPRARLVLR